MKSLPVIVILVLALSAFVLVEWRPWQEIAMTAPSSPGSQVSGKVSNSQVTGSFANGADIPGEQSNRHTQVSTEFLNQRPIYAAVNPSSPARGLSEQLIKAQLIPANHTTLVAEIGTRVLRIDFKDGESFDKGAVLMAFDCEMPRAQLQRVNAELAIAQRNADANARLLARGAVSQLEADNARSELDRTRAQARELEVLVSKCAVIAPYAGKVAERFVREERFVQAGEPLMDILDDSAMELEFIVPSTWVAWLNQGYAFEVDMEETQRSYPAVVSGIGARIDPISRTVKVVGVIDGQFAELKPGMSGAIRVKAPEQLQQQAQ